MLCACPVIMLTLAGSRRWTPSVKPLLCFSVYPTSLWSHWQHSVSANVLTIAGRKCCGASIGSVALYVNICSILDHLLVSMYLCQIQHLPNIPCFFFHSPRIYCSSSSLSHMSSFCLLNEASLLIKKCIILQLFSLQTRKIKDGRISSNIYIYKNFLIII